jgi:Zn-dependent alcohol dehydrogenase
MRKCKTIIAIDRIESRLQDSLSLGATHIINTSDPSIDIRSEVHKITEGKGVQVSLDTTGVYELARQSYDFVRNFGKVLQVGLARPGDNWDISMVDLMNSGKQILGCVQGDVIPQLYIPEMVSWYKASIFPIDKIVKFYDARDFEQALRDMRRGITVKPILVWPYSSKEHDPTFSL